MKDSTGHLRFSCFATNAGHWKSVFHRATINFTIVVRLLEYATGMVKKKKVATE